MKNRPLRSAVKTEPRVLKRDKHKKYESFTPKAQNDTREIALTRIFLGMTLIAWAFATWGLVDILWQRFQTMHWLVFLEQILFIVLVQSLIYGNLLYQLTRLGHFKRRATHRPVSRELLETIDGGVAPDLTILVPSFKEEISVIQRTLLSAALQDYPNRRVVLLIDDPPNPKDPWDQATLTAVRQLPFTIQTFLEEAAAPFAEAYDQYFDRHLEQTINVAKESVRLVALCHQAAVWFEKQAAGYLVLDPADALFVRKIFAASAEAHRQRAKALWQAALVEELSEQRIQREYQRLATLFQVEVTSFERKSYINLSQTSNKAMNLNSYIGLIGKNFRRIKREEGLYLEQVEQSEAKWCVPDADFLITLDADSFLTTDYALRLIHIMMAPDNERIAVAQTPYSAVPGARGALERIAGATTDIQYLIHQGFTEFNATFWVGANALLRKSALDHIRVIDQERGFQIVKYIQDRTVIEDTESSVDLIERGFRLYNYPERLAYSATPPDFGALLIQRQRWANGGLIILPKLLRYLWRRPKWGAKLVEGFFRSHYLISIAAVNISLLVLMAIPFKESIQSLWLPLTAIPYFFLYGRDLVQMGYRWTDLFRVYAFNLMLIPVNLSGVIKSLHQAITRRKIPFSRTPKVIGRTATPQLYIFLEYALLFHWLVVCALDTMNRRWTHASFSVINATFLGWAMIRFIGLKESKEDFIYGIKEKQAK
ncbi:MAG: glycosyltransferase [Nitrospirae bacterium]|nr:glycosyltransferase [Candidatus Troglogloeales bacterium]